MLSVKSIGTVMQFGPTRQDLGDPESVVVVSSAIGVVGAGG